MADRQPGFFEEIGEAITGSRRATPETRSLPEYTGMPELNRLTMPSFKAALGTLQSSPDETVQILQANFPHVKVRQDEKGNYILRSALDQKEYAIPPGVSVGDIPRIISGIASFVPAGLASTIPRAAGVAATNQAVIEASQAGTGGTFNPEDVAIAGVLGGAIPAVGKGIKAAAPAVTGAARMFRRGMKPMEVPEVPRVKESRYETAQEGPFLRVKPRSAQAAGSKDRGVREEVRPPDAAPGSGRGDVPQPVSDEAISLLIKDPSNFVRRAADDYSQRAHGQGYSPPQMPSSSLAKQSAIGRAFVLAADGGDDYKKAVFEAYGRSFPELIESTGAKNYDQLVEMAYRQLNKETADQFHTLPVNMSFHRAGEGNYQSSGEMLRDVYGNRHLYVFQGGEPHPMMNRVDPETGLNDTEMFRAVHDFYGHAAHGNSFGQKGEEIAYGAHAQMYSPLARIAMATETRGQNSFVNFTPVNAELKARINRLNELRYEASRRGQESDVKAIDKLIGEAWQDFQFGPQKSVLLPPEFIDTGYAGGMPGYIQPLIRPEPGTTASEMLTHFSNVPDLVATDPSRYGSGIAGREMQRLKETMNPVMERSYFYAGDPSRVQPEPGLGRFRYGTRSEGLYDIEKDPLLLRTLAAEANRRPYTAKYNQGLTDPSQAFTDVERMAKEYGYEGLMNPSQGTAIMYRPTPVQPFAKGGAVKPIKQGIKRAIQSALDVLSPADTEVNKERFLEGSKVQDRLYHATPHDFSEFMPGGVNPELSGPAIASGAERAGAAIGRDLAPKAGEMVDDLLRKQGLLLDAAPTGKSPQTVSIYHGGNTGLEEIKGGVGPGNIFGGIFGSQDRRVAASHGDGSVYRIDVPKDEILSQQMLDSMDHLELAGALKKAMPWLKKEDVDDAFRAVIEDKAHKVSDDSLMKIFREDSPGEAGWEAQRIRGEVARLLGKKAVEMADEHGVSYLILPGAKPILDVDKKAEGGLVSNTDTIKARLIEQGMPEDKAFMQALKLANEVQMAKGGLAGLKNLPAAAKAAKAGKAVKPVEVLPPEESQANLGKFVEGSKVQDRLYHATPKSFSEFKPGGDNSELSGPAIWMTPNKEFQPAAHNIKTIPGQPGRVYRNKDQFTPGTNVMPLYSSVKNPLIATEETWRADFKPFGGSPWTLTKEEVAKMTAAGHDGIMYYDRSGNLAEVIAFQPEQVKSAIGNRGSFDPTSKDITKRRGGLAVAKGSR